MGRKKREVWRRRVCRKKNGERERGSEDNQITELWMDEMEEESKKTEVSNKVLYCVRDGDGWGMQAAKCGREQKERQKTGTCETSHPRPGSWTTVVLRL